MTPKNVVSKNTMLKNTTKLEKINKNKDVDIENLKKKVQ